MVETPGEVEDRYMNKRFVTAMSSSEASDDARMGWSKSGWGDSAPGFGMTGVTKRVLGGRWVWPHAFFMLAAARDWRSLMGHRMAEVDDMPGELGPQTVGYCFLDRVLRGEDVDWGTRDVPEGEVDRVLAALGLYHVRV